MKCSICGRTIEGYGHSPSPLNGIKCCDDCNMKVVMPIRIFLRSLDKEEYALLIKKDEVHMVKPDDEYFTLKELQTAVGGYIQITQSLFTNYLDVVDEEGLLKRRNPNNIMYLLTQRKYVGDILICPKAIFEKPEVD